MTDTLIFDIKHLGNLWHYGHFFYDCILLINSYIYNNKCNNITKIIILQKNFRDSLGVFKSTIENVLSCIILEENYDEYKNNKNIIEINAEDYNRTYNDYNNLYIQCSKLLSLKEHSYDIILIERSIQNLKTKNIMDYIKTNVNIKKNLNNGSLRASIKNHNDIKEKLQEKYGDKFKNVILEEMTLDEQVSIFKTAKIIIGQHGAGLCNIAWVQRPNVVVFEINPIRNNCWWYKNMTIEKKFKYVGDVSENITGDEMIKLIEKETENVL